MKIVLKNFEKSVNMSIWLMQRAALCTHIIIWRNGYTHLYIYRSVTGLPIEKGGL